MQLAKPANHFASPWHAGNLAAYGSMVSNCFKYAAVPFAVRFGDLAGQFFSQGPSAGNVFQLCVCCKRRSRKVLGRFLFREKIDHVSEEKEGQEKRLVGVKCRDLPILFAGGRT